jgi:hypothetical protein
MIDTTAIEKWVRGYVVAWGSDAPDDIVRLFTPDARYSPSPFEEPCVGAENIAAWWIDQGDSQIPWTFEHDVVGRDEDRYVVRGVTRYPEGLEERGKAEVYHNLWLVTLDPDGRAREFVEYWMLEE